MINDLENGVVDKIVTRIPPEPNAYLHIGHARAIITNFELAKYFGGVTNLRFDDTNPTQEDVEFVEAIQKDIEWLGYTPPRLRDKHPLTATSASKHTCGSLGKCGTENIRVIRKH